MSRTPPRGILTILSAVSGPARFEALLAPEHDAADAERDQENDREDGIADDHDRMLGALGAARRHGDPFRLERGARTFRRHPLRVQERDVVRNRRRNIGSLRHRRIGIGARIGAGRSHRRPIGTARLAAAGYANPDPSFRRVAFCGGTGCIDRTSWRILRRRRGRIARLRRHRGRSGLWRRGPRRGRLGRSLRRRGLRLLSGILRPRLSRGLRRQEWRDRLLRSRLRRLTATTDAFRASPEASRDARPARRVARRQDAADPAVEAPAGAMPDVSDRCRFRRVAGSST